MAEGNTKISTFQDLVDDVLTDKDFDGEPALEWSAKGLALDDVTLGLKREELLGLLSKAGLAIYIQMEAINNLYEELTSSYEEQILDKKTAQKLKTMFEEMASTKYEFYQNVFSKQRAKTAAKIRLSMDKKQRQLCFCYDRFVEWKEQNYDYTMYKNNTDFANKMIDKFEPEDPEDKTNLNNVSHLARKVGQWKKGKDIPDSGRSLVVN